MAWPTAVITTGMDADTDSLPRSDILDLTTKFNAVLAYRGAVDGICDLDGSGLVPDARISAAIARLASPAFTGVPAAPTAAAGTSTTQIATTAFIAARLNALSPVAPATGDYLAIRDVSAGADAKALVSDILALSASGIGSGQTWKNTSTLTRAVNTTYTNSTGKPIMVNVMMNVAATVGADLLVDSLVVANCNTSTSGGVPQTLSAIVPNGSTYRVNSSAAINGWAELS